MTYGHRDEKERSGRLRPGWSRRTNTSPRPITGTALNLLRLARLVSRSSNGSVVRSRSSEVRAAKASSLFQRRCIVNVRFANGRTPGGWKAHGKYVERDSAKGEVHAKDDPGFAKHDAGDRSDPADRLGLAKTQSLASLADSWQNAGDKRIFKIILSPEDGEANLAETAGQIISHIEEHLGTSVTWGGVVHRNTDHPHAHLIVRGRVRTDDAFKLPPEMIRNGLRQAAQASITRQLGPRTIEDIRRQRREELSVNRVTPLDRQIIQRGRPSQEDTTYLRVGKTVTASEQSRLGYLMAAGLAKADPREGWLIRANTIPQLRQMKDLQDRARILFRSGVAISDPHAPMEYSSSAKRLVGRVLLNSEDERTGALQTVFETTEGKIEILNHDSTLRAAWGRGDLEPGNVVTIDTLRSDPSKLYAVSVGRDIEILKDSASLDSLVRRMRTMGLTTIEGDKGWLGELSSAIRQRAIERDRQRAY